MLHTHTLCSPISTLAPPLRSLRESPIEPASMQKHFADRRRDISIPLAAQRPTIDSNRYTQINTGREVAAIYNGREKSHSEATSSRWQRTVRGFGASHEQSVQSADGPLMATASMQWPYQIAVQRTQHSTTASAYSSTGPQLATRAATAHSLTDPRELQRGNDEDMK